MFDTQVLAAGGGVVKGMVRLHHMDTQWWHIYVLHACALARHARVRVFTVYSKSYGLGDAVYQ